MKKLTPSPQYVKDFPIAASVPKAAHALRPMRIGRDEVAIHYTATSFVDPYRGCEITLRRMESCGLLEPRTDGPLRGSRFVDVLDEDGDILDTIGVTRHGFEYLRSKLRFRREAVAK